MNAKNAFGAITVAFALFFLWPAVFGSWAEMRALKAAVAEREQIVSERASILENAAKEYAKYQAVLKGASATTFTSLVPAKKDTAELVSAVSTIATSSGMQLAGIQISEQRAADKTSLYSTMKITLDLTGEYGGIRSFLRDLEAYVRILNVKTLDFSAAEDGTMRFSLEAETYYIK